MRRFLFCWLIVFLALGAFVPAADAGYGFSRTLTVDNAKVPNTNQTNFAVLYCFNGIAPPCDNASLTVAALKTLANGGKVTNNSGFDIAFGTNITCTTPLAWEMEFYSPTTGATTAWVNIPSLLTAAPTQIFMCYGNAAISTFQGNVNGTWNANTLRVYHLPNGTTLQDPSPNSTSVASDGTLVGVPLPVAATGQIDGAANFNTVNQAITAVATGLPTTGTSSVSAWIKTTSILSSMMVNWGTGGVSIYLGYGFVAGLPYLGDQTTLVSGATAINDGAWHLIHGTYNGVNLRTVYVDGASDGSDANTLTGGTTNIYLGANQNAVGTFGVVGDIDEARVYNVELTPDWIATEWNNQSDPATFYAIGAEVGIGNAGRMLLMGVG